MARWARRLVALLLPLLVLEACGSSSGRLGQGSVPDRAARVSTSVSGTGPAPDCEARVDPEAPLKVPVVLSEWSVRPAIARTRISGRITFIARNAGSQPHELLIVRSRTPDALPVDDRGAVSEEALKGNVIGEIEEFPPGRTCAATFELRPGSYVLVCNMVERRAGRLESHYQLGMRATFAVTRYG